MARRDTSTGNIIEKLANIQGQLTEVRYQMSILTSRRDMLIAIQANLQSEFKRSIEQKKEQGTQDDDKLPTQ